MREPSFLRDVLGTALEGSRDHDKVRDIMHLHFCSRAFTSVEWGRRAAYCGNRRAAPTGGGVYVSRERAREKRGLANWIVHHGKSTNKGVCMWGQSSAPGRLFKWSEKGVKRV